tara:strand:+ start:3200 stop:3526 length:327 start_codon:yes stop_codon:yes gene_type:complete
MYKYGVQWVDDGGPFEHYTTIEEVEEVLEKIDPSIKVMNDGGVTLNDGTTHYCITTSEEVPYWSIGFVRESMHRYSELADLWLYTFSLNEEIVDKYHSHDDYIDMVEW